MTTTGHDLRRLERHLHHPAAPGEFGEDELVGLPEPVARYFRVAITPGAPLARAAEIEMRGRLKLNGRWLRFRAHEVLSPHDGFVWRARVAGLVAGSDRLVDGHGTGRWAEGEFLRCEVTALTPIVDSPGRESRE